MLIFEFCPDIVIKMFGAESQLYMEFARLTFRIFLFFVALTCMIKVSSIFFQAVGNPIKGSCVIVGRAADYILRDNKKIIRIFIYAPEDYRVQSIMEMYGDSKVKAKKNIIKSDKNRANYYKLISGKTFGYINNYDLCIDSSIGVENTAEVICNFIKSKSNK